MIEILNVYDLERLTGVSISTIRKYSDMGYLDCTRDSQGVRLFSEDAKYKLLRLRHETHLSTSKNPKYVLLVKSDNDLLSFLSYFYLKYFKSIDIKSISIEEDTCSILNTVFDLGVVDKIYCPNIHYNVLDKYSTTLKVNGILTEILQIEQDLDFQRFLHSFSCCRTAYLVLELFDSMRFFKDSFEPLKSELLTCVNSVLKSNSTRFCYNFKYFKVEDNKIISDIPITTNTKFSYIFSISTGESHFTYDGVALSLYLNAFKFGKKLCNLATIHSENVLHNYYFIE